LKITDRKKELLKTSGGKYVAPTPIESSLKEDLLVEQAMVVGDNMKFVSVIIQPTFESLKNWCKENSVDFGNDMKAVLSNPKVLAHYQQVIDTLNPNLGKVEQVFPIQASILSSKIPTVAYCCYLEKVRPVPNSF
jgi:long-chain acyl-CoA synthetase